MVQTSCARCRVAGADLSKAGRLLDGDNTEVGLITQALAGPRFERMVERLHHLGARSTAELLIEIAKATDEPALIVRHLEAYSRLDPEIVRAVGGDRFPPMLMEVAH